jgi:hypothetical protein
MIAGGCESMRGESDGSASTNPTAQRTLASQQQSEEALVLAHEAQRKASEQANRAAEAEAEVQKAQQALVLAQERARAEQKEAVQLQKQASQQTREAARTAQQSQVQAEQALRDEGEQLAHGEQSTSGHVTKASGSHVTLRQPDGTSMTFQVTGGTQVMLDGRRSQAMALSPGEQALIDYKLSGAEPVAVLIQAASGNARHTGTGSVSTSAARTAKSNTTKSGTTKSGATKSGATKPGTANASTPGATGCDVTSVLQTGTGQ